jgi:hypothetical protein
MKCIKCDVEIPEGRLKAIPGTRTCVKHSSAEKLIGVPVSLGEGDHNYNELMIVTPEEFEQMEYYKKLQQDL